MEPIDRLRQQYKLVSEARKLCWQHTQKLRENDYYGMRLLCLDCELVSFSEIELMEFEVDNEFV